MTTNARSGFYGDASYLMAMIVLVALVAPTDIVSRFPSLATLAHASSSYLPFIAGCARFSPWPEVMTLTFLLSMPFEAGLGLPCPRPDAA